MSRFFHYFSSWHSFELFFALFYHECDATTFYVNQEWLLTCGTGSFNSDYLHTAASGPCCDVWCCDMVWLCCIYQEMQTRSISLILKEWGLWRFSRMQRFPQQLMPVFQFPGKLSITFECIWACLPRTRRLFLFQTTFQWEDVVSPPGKYYWKDYHVLLLFVFIRSFSYSFFHKYQNIVTRTNNWIETALF